MNSFPFQRISYSDRLAALAGWVLRRRRLTIACWLVLLVFGGVGAGSVSKRLSFDFALPGQAGYETANQIQRLYGNGGSQAPTLLVVTVPHGKSVVGSRAVIGSAFARLRRQERMLRIVDYAVSGDRRLISRDGRSTYAFAFSPAPKGFSSTNYSKVATRALANDLPSGFHVAATGLQELANHAGTGGSGILAETLVGALGALAVLAFVFASFLALIPLVIAAFSILTTLLIVLGVSYVASTSAIVEYLIALVGLGVAIDYSLLIVTRWREERERGLSNEAAIVAASATAGRAVLLSGLTVGIGLVALIVLPVPAMRSIGFGGMLIPLVSVAVSLTLLPAILGAIGPRIDWPTVRKERRASCAWTAWGVLVSRHKWVAAVFGLSILGLLVVPAFHATTGETGVSALASRGPAVNAYRQLTRGGMPAGALTPLEVLTRSADAPAARVQLAAVPGIVDTLRATGAGSNRHGTTVLLGIPAAATVNSRTLTPVRAATSKLEHTNGVIGVAGEGAISVAYENAVFGNFPLVLSLIALLTFVLLARAFRSVLLALKALVLNALSLAATFGLVTLFWQEGHGSKLLFGIPATGAITFWIPLLIVAFLYGLSMDYEVFILTRIREEYETTHSTRAAVVQGLGRTGRLVTSAALILFLAFSSLAAAPPTDLKVFATALGAGILLDATVVRGLLLPALVTIFGCWNWWMPALPARILRIGPASHSPELRELPAQGTNG